jgi:hypothetical protein
MLKKTRPDGTYLKNLPHYIRILPYLMPKRTDCSNYFELDFDITHTLEYIREKNNGRQGDEKRISFFEVFLCGAVRALALRPKLNRFISGYNYYQRNRILFNFIAKKKLTDEGDEINVTIPFSAEETLSTLSAKVRQSVSRSKRGDDVASDNTNVLLMKMPRWMVKLVFRFLPWLDYHNMLPGSFINSMPFWASVFFTNVGSVGIDAPFHHNFNLGTCGLFISLGIIRKDNAPAAGAAAARSRVKVTFTFDDRICDGIYCGKAVDLFRDFVENPEKLESPPQLSAEQRAELMLKE